MIIRVLFCQKFKYIYKKHLHDRYAAHVKEKLCQTQIVEIRPITGKTIFIKIAINIPKQIMFCLGVVGVDIPLTLLRNII
ncbi:juvenile hormone acid O-methyltransferase-like [Aphis craccivora]|uniref:Juvenile hormone acid O-methyltransferase-like n=1 Tax=Aphis craccivora TaxID=307492 RepID=A0A6G0ZIG2_APHCR|nr:juvenile hormone acid O-methyltransferase-like [Aphis craccivora]